MFSKEYRLKNDIYIFYHLHDTRVESTEKYRWNRYTGEFFRF